MRGVVIVAMLALSGCLADDGALDQDGDGFSDEDETLAGSDPQDPTSVPVTVVEHEEEISIDDTVNTVGTGVPTVQCPADAVNVQTVVWSIVANKPDATDTWVTDMVFTVAGAVTVNDVDLFVYGPDGNLLGSGTGSTNQETVTVGGKRALGDYTIEARGCSGAGEVEVSGQAVLRWTTQS